MTSTHQINTVSAMATFLGTKIGGHKGPIIDLKAIKKQGLIGSNVLAHAV